MNGANPFGPHRYVVVEGPIGVGKTTMMKRLSTLTPSRVILEIFEENAFLPLFYQDRDRYAFQTELFFLLSRYRQQQQLGQLDLFNQVTLSDYLFYKNLIFSGLTLQDPSEWKLYSDVYEALAPQVPRPDIVVLLDAPLDVLLGRIKKRGRSFETNMDPDYLLELARRYRREFQHWTECPILRVDTSHLDLPNDDEALELVVREIARTTSGSRVLEA